MNKVKINITDFNGGIAEGEENASKKYKNIPSVQPGDLIHFYQYKGTKNERFITGYIVTIVRWSAGLFFTIGDGKEYYIDEVDGLYIVSMPQF